MQISDPGPHSYKSVTLHIPLYTLCNELWSCLGPDRVFDRVEFASTWVWNYVAVFIIDNYITFKFALISSENILILFYCNFFFLFLYCNEFLLRY
jgi:hypothetical protein